MRWLLRALRGADRPPHAGGPLSPLIKTLPAESTVAAKISDSGKQPRKTRKPHAKRNPLMSKRSFRGLLSALLPEAGVACGGMCWAFT